MRPGCDGPQANARLSAVRALVTGGAGFIGSHLCDQLVARGYRVQALDDLSTGSRDNLDGLAGHREFTLLERDVRFRAELHQQHLQREPLHVQLLLGPICTRLVRVPPCLLDSCCL